MNRERLLELRKTLVWLRDTPVLPDGTGFSMAAWRREKEGCNTVMCLAGWHVELNPGCGLVFQKGGPWQTLCISIVGKPLQLDNSQAERLYGPYENALSPLMEYFDISEQATEALFTLMQCLESPRPQIAAHALRILDYLLQHGDIDMETVKSLVL